jgi:hypothetical protein
MFLHGTFRVSDLSAGGFDKGTTFVHIRTGEKCIVDANGTARMVFPGRNKKRGKKLVFVKPVKRVIGSGGANATL